LCFTITLSQRAPFTHVHPFEWSTYAKCWTLGSSNIFRACCATRSWIFKTLRVPSDSQHFISMTILHRAHMQTTFRRNVDMEIIVAFSWEKVLNFLASSEKITTKVPSSTLLKERLWKERSLVCAFSRMPDSHWTSCVAPLHVMHFSDAGFVRF